MSSAEPAQANDSPAAIAKGDGSGFDKFCAKWMAKLHKREKQAASDKAIREYKGYTASPDKCEARPTGSPSSPYVGQLVYQEIQYRKKGSTPEAVSQMEVMEIFRHDGKKWVW